MKILDLIPRTNAYAWITRDRSLAGWGSAGSIDPGEGPRRFERASAQLAEVFERFRSNDAESPVAFASFTFDPDAAGSSVVVPERVFWSSPDGAVRLITDSGDVPNDSAEALGDFVPRIRYAGSTISEVRWLEAVDEAVKQVVGGGIDKVVLARDLHVWAKEDLDVRVLAARLTRRFPQCFTYIHDGLVGSTPELLVRRFGDDVSSLVLAGTAARGATQDEDARIGAELRGSLKAGDEHRFAVESVQRVFADVCSEHRVEPRPFLLKLANVQHLATRVSGTLGASLSALELAGLLHPTAAVCGAPTADALELIRKLEGMERGRYGGPVGWVDSNGNGEFGIALRCAEVDGARARLFAGNGIVAGSLPEDELEETRLKLNAMQRALEQE